MNDAIYALIGTAFGCGISLIGTYLMNKNNIRLEKMKMHEKERIKAHGNLLHFSDRIMCSPDDEIHTHFLDVMKIGFYKNIFPNYLYYNKNIRDLLNELKSQYICWGHTDYWDFEESVKFLRENLNDIATKLQELCIEDVEKVIR